MTGTDMLHVESLTRREREMAQAVSRGLRNRQIAIEYGISEETVKKHLATIYGKLALHGRVALAVHVLRAGDVIHTGPPRDGGIVTAAAASL
ncbi:MAG: helix-turn-helix transcriptional regulator [Acidobacteriota bacterium]